MRAGGFFFQAEDGIRDLVRSRGLGDVYKRQGGTERPAARGSPRSQTQAGGTQTGRAREGPHSKLSLIHI